MLTLNLSIAWWWLPIALVLAGALVGAWRASRYRASEWFDVRGMVFIFWFAMFCAAAVGVAGAKVLFSL